MHYPPTSDTPLLQGKTVIVAGSLNKAQKLVSGLEKLGARVLPLHVIAIREVSDKRALDAALRDLGAYTWIIFTSSYGVQFFAQRMKELEITMDSKGDALICAVGPATAAALEERGFKVDMIPQEFVAEGILKGLTERHGGLSRLAGRRILIPRAKEARDILPSRLSAAGARVDIAYCYETTVGQIDDATLAGIKSRKPDLLVFTSSSTINNFAAIVGDEPARDMMKQVAVAVIGPITEATAKSFGKDPEIVPEENTVDSLLDAIRGYFETRLK
jgi:uroporphyrinogen III methyltransferase / synthase